MRDDDEIDSLSLRWEHYQFWRDFDAIRHPPWQPKKVNKNMTEPGVPMYLKSAEQIRQENIDAFNSAMGKLPIQTASPLDVQIGGNHYKSLKIQPVEYILANSLGFCEGNVVKYITRWRDKGGVQDLEKIKHFVDILIEQEKK